MRICVCRTFQPEFCAAVVSYLTEEILAKGTTDYRDILPQQFNHFFNVYCGQGKKAARCNTTPMVAGGEVPPTAVQALFPGQDIKGCLTVQDRS